MVLEGELEYRELYWNIIDVFCGNGTIGYKVQGSNAFRVRSDDERRF